MTQAEGDAKPDGPEPKRDEPAKTQASDEQLQRLKRRPPTAQERYQLEGEIGRGGMGAVLRVRDLDLRRNLAMKVVLGQGAGAASGDTPAVDPQVLQRFLDEAQITGQLDHPGVVPVHELGIDAGGRVYFTMKLVKGDTADVVFGKARDGEDGWTETRALEVILKVCDTMSFAHQKGVLHRDLKPSNVMVGKFGEVYVMDWGLAKVLGEPDRRDLRIRPESTVSKVHTDRSKAEADSDSPLLTMDGAIVGTPCYMAPEQAEGRIEVLDQRADVYAVGAMLYQLLTGQQPYVSPGARVSPYAVLAAVQAGPPKAVHALRKSVPAELIAICDKAMAREMARRYAGMRELSNDLRAFLEKRVVHAYRTGPGAELVMWVRRNRALAAAMVAVVLVLAGGIVTSTTFAWRAERVAAVQKQQLVEASWGAFNQADRLFSTADSATSEPVRLTAAREGLLQLARALAFDPANGVAWERFANEASRRRAVWTRPEEAVTFEHAGEVWSATFSPDGTRVVTASLDNTAKVWDASSGKALHTFEHGGGVLSAVFSPDGTRVLTASVDKTARVWDALSGKALHTLEHGDTVLSATFSPDGARVVTASDKTAKVWDASSGKALHTFEHGDTVLSATFSPDGTRVVTASNDHTAKVWDASSGKALHTFEHGDTVYSPTFSPDGTCLVTASRDKTARVWDASSGKALHTFEHGGVVSSATFSPDGTRVVTASNDHTAKVWDASSGKALHTFEHGDAVYSATFTPDGTRVVTASDDHTAKVWDASSGKALHTFEHGDTVYSATFSPDGTRVVTASRDKTAKVWDASSGKALHTFEHGDTVYSATFSPDGTRVVTASGDNSAKVWDASSGKALHTFEHGDAVSSATFSPDGTRVVTASGDNSAKVWDASSSKALHTLDHSGAVYSATFSPDGTRVVTASQDNTAKVWDASTGKALHTFEHGGVVRSAAFSPDGTRVVTASRDNTAKVWDASTGKALHTFEHGDYVNAATFSPDGTRVVTASLDNTAKVWDASSGKALHTFEHGSAVSSASFSPDGTRVVTASDDKTAKVWDASSGKALHTLEHGDTVYSATFSPDGTRVVTASRDNTAKVWDASSGKALHTFEHGDAVYSATFSPDGTRVVTAGLDHTAGVFQVHLACTLGLTAAKRDVALVTALAELMTGHTLSPESEFAPLTDARRQQDRVALQEILEVPSALTPLARWLTSHGPDSPAYPGATITCRQRADILVDGGAISAREALHLDPVHPLVHIALAAHEAVPEQPDNADQQAAAGDVETRRAFLRDYDLRRLPDDAGICARAASMLLQQGDKPRALTAANKALAIEPSNATALRIAEEAKR